MKGNDNKAKKSIDFVLPVKETPQTIVSVMLGLSIAKRNHLLSVPCMCVLYDTLSEVVYSAAGGTHTHNNTHVFPRTS